MTETLATIGDALDLLSRETTVHYNPYPHTTGCKILLPNRWTVSLSYGASSYSSLGVMSRIMECAVTSPEEVQAMLTLLHDTPPDVVAHHATTAEVAIFTPRGAWLIHDHDDDRFSGQTWGFIYPPDVLRIVDAVATVEQHGKCPCPNCVLTPTEDDV